MATDTNSLLAEATCYDCGGGFGQLQLLKLGLLRQILLATDPMADTSVNGLLAAANCYNSCAGSPGLMQLLELALLRQIVDGGGVGGGGGVTYGTSDPVAAPAGDSGFFYRTDTFQLWVWNSATASWDPLIS